MLVEPVGEAVVEIGPHRLGERVVGGVPDQQVAEAVAVVARELGAVGADELAADECCQPGRHLRLLGSERLDGAAVEDLALDRAALEHAALGPSSWSSRAASSAFSVGGTSTSRILGRHREHLGDEERIAAGGAGDPLAQLAGHGVADQRVGLLRAEAVRVAAHRASPGAAPPAPAGPCTRSRSGAPAESSAVDSTRSRNVSSPHWMSSNTTTSGACSSSSLRNAHAISSPLVRDVRLAEKRADRRCRAGVGRQHRELLHHLDHRPVGDPLAVGKATAADDARVRRERAPRRRAATCRRRPRRPPSPARSARLRAPAPTPANDQRELPLATDEPRRRGCARARPAPSSSRNAGTGSAFPSAPAAPPAPRRPRRARAPCVAGADQHLARLRPPARAAPRR